MKKIEDFTKEQKKKFLFAQIISNILTINGIRHKIGGSFVNFLNYNKKDFHDIDIILIDDSFDYTLNMLNFYLKYKEIETIYSLDYKNRCKRINFGDGITIDILTDIMHPECQSSKILDTFNGINLETEGNVNKARKMIKENILPQLIMPDEIKEMQHQVLNSSNYESIILKLYGDFAITHNKEADCAIFFNKLKEDDRYDELNNIN